MYHNFKRLSTSHYFTSVIWSIDKITCNRYLIYELFYETAISLAYYCIYIYRMNHFNVLFYLLNIENLSSLFFFIHPTQMCMLTKKYKKNKRKKKKKPNTHTHTHKYNNCTATINNMGQVVANNMSTLV